MRRSLSLRLDEDDQATLESAAKRRGVGLSTYLRQLAADEAKRVRRELIRQQSKEVGMYVADSPDAHSFYADRSSVPPDGTHA
jgi:uncharacterized protein (DUF1778 family)